MTRIDLKENSRPHLLSVNFLGSYLFLGQFHHTHPFDKEWNQNTKHEGLHLSTSLNRKLAVYSINLNHMKQILPIKLVMKYLYGEKRRLKTG